MGVSAQQGPLWIYVQRPTIGAGGSNNPDAAPSGFFAGIGIADPRVGYNVTRQGGIMWYGADPVCIDQVPSAISTTAIAAAQVPVAATPMTLVSATGAGITVTSSATVVWASGNTVPSGSLAIDGLPGLVGLGNLNQLSTGATRLSAYDPTKAIARAVAIASIGNDSAATFTVAGYDLYGYPQTETITGASGATATGKKAFKFITSITPAGTLSGSNASAGQSDVYGLPFFASRFGAYTTFFWNSAGITAITGFVAGDATTPATATTGDVRGTYAVQSASDGTKRLQMVLTPAVANCLTSIGLFGVTPA
jgi:hypothetical protein